MAYILQTAFSSSFTDIACERFDWNCIRKSQIGNKSILVQVMDQPE